MDRGRQFEGVHEEPEFMGRMMRWGGRTFPVSEHKDFSDDPEEPEGSGLNRTKHVVTIPLENGLQARALIGKDKSQVTLHPSKEDADRLRVVYHPDLAKVNPNMIVTRGDFKGMGVGHWNGPNTEAPEKIEQYSRIPSEAKNFHADNDTQKSW